MNKKESRDLKIFAYIWTFIFILIGGHPLLYSNDIKLWSLVIAFIFFIIGLKKPYILLDFYKAWIKISEFIGGIISKIIMFILYFGLFTPISFVLKLLGKDLLGKKLDINTKTYWIEREIQPESMKKQF